MRTYIGQDIRNVELAYGPPVNQIDLGNGARAFQWLKISTDTTPLTAVSTTDKDKKGRKTPRRNSSAATRRSPVASTPFSPPGTQRQTAGSSPAFASLAWTVPSAIYPDQAPAAT